MENKAERIRDKFVLVRFVPGKLFPRRDTRSALEHFR